MLKTLASDFKALDKLLYLLFACSLVSRLGTLVYPFLAIYFSNVVGLSVAGVGLMLSIGSLGMICGNFTSGHLADRWDTRKVIILSFFVKIIGFMGILLFKEYQVILVVFLFVALFGMGLYGPAGNMLIANTTEEKNRQFAYMVDYVFRNIGMGLGPLMGGVLVSYSFNWVFIGDILASGLCILLLIFGLRQTVNAVVKKTQINQDKRSFLALTRHYPGITLFCLGGIFLIGVLFGMEYLVPLMVVNVFNGSTVIIGAIYTLNASIILLGSFVIERYIRGKNEIAMMLVSAMFWMFGMVIVTLGMNSGALMIGVALWTLGEIIYSIITPAFTAKNAPEEYKGRFLSLVDFSVSFARLILPVGLGYIWAQHGLQVALYSVTLMPLIGFVLYIGLFMHYSQKGYSAVVGSVEK